MVKKAKNISVSDKENKKKTLNPKKKWYY
jgi:hypothetical protein